MLVFQFIVYCQVNNKVFFLRKVEFNGTGEILLRGIERGITKSWSRSPVTLVSGKGLWTCSPIFKTLVTLPFQRVCPLLFVVRFHGRVIFARNQGISIFPFLRIPDIFFFFFFFFFTLLVTSSFYTWIIINKNFLRIIRKKEKKFNPRPKFIKMLKNEMERDLIISLKKKDETIINPSPNININETMTRRGWKVRWRSHTYCTIHTFLWHFFPRYYELRIISRCCAKIV